eukprot:CAMPEP_0172436286 /NCGR_PEP_ID=MMETSP1064-20121228/71645_1 /TAXON_ID=202472 /ORGANISM="Aulacoseira subarctica , Strain CCAP 1002/5" /LENGTH=474 /DNA_ID=CAMNT_0013184685 /DNA_START=314 /DNA_END=1738 /DNA_ORIENTATION=-
MLDLSAYSFRSAPKISHYYSAEVIAPQINEAADLLHRNSLLAIKDGDVGFKCIFIPQCAKDIAFLDGESVGEIVVTFNTSGVLSQILLTPGEIKRKAKTLSVYSFIEKIRLYITGDLAYQATVMGKENSSGHHCPQCKLNCKTWSDADHEKGAQWTNAGLCEAAREFAQQEQVDPTVKKKAVKGVVEPPHYPGIEPVNFVVPILHMQMGKVNKIIGGCSNFIEEEVENIPSEEIIGRREVSSENAVLESLHLEREKVLFEKYVVKRELRIELREAKKKLKSADVGSEQFIKIEEDILEITTEINEWDEVEEDWRQSIQSSKEQLKAKKEHLKKMESKRPLTAQNVSRKIQNVFKNNHIHPEAYHGGDLNGVCSRRLMVDAQPISPKVHIFEDHAAEQQRKHGGVADKSEDFVELSHQDGKREHRRTGRITNFEKQHICAQKNEWVMSDPKIQTQINEVQIFHRRKNLKRSLPLG